MTIIYTASRIVSQVTSYKLWERRREHEAQQARRDGLSPLLSQRNISRELADNYINPDKAWQNDAFCCAYQSYKAREIDIERLIDIAEELNAG